MKQIIGILLLFLSIALAGVLVLWIWDIEVVSLTTIIKSTATLIILGAAIILLIIIYGALLRSDHNQYNHKSGNRAHPKL